MSNLIEVTDDTFEAVVLRSPVPVLVDFFAEHCGPCRLVRPVLVELASELGDRARVVTVDVMANERLAEKYGISVVPTLVVFRAAFEVHRLVGLKTKDYLREALAA